MYMQRISTATDGVKFLEGCQFPFQKYRKGRKDGREEGTGRNRDGEEGGRRDEGEMAGKETERERK